MPKKKKQAKYKYQIERCKESLIRGTILAIDPSSGSTGSLPGYAIFEAGELKENGVLDIKVGRELPRRLQDIATTLKEQFPEVDVLVIEDIPSMSYGRRGGAHASLLKAVGCFLGAAKYQKFVEISPSSWKSYLRKNEKKFPNYDKMDDWDAVILGYCAIDTALEMMGEKHE